MGKCLTRVVPVTIHTCIKLFALIPVVSLLLPQSHADELADRFRTTRVAVEVSSSDAVGNQIKSYVSRELRSLGDVEVVSENADFRFRILAMELHAGGVSGVGLSTIIVSDFDNDYVVQVANPEKKDVV
jgi:hypothetical protein